MPKRLKLPDGTTYSFPDDTTPAELDEFLSSLESSAPPSGPSLDTSSPKDPYAQFGPARFAVGGAVQAGQEEAAGGPGFGEKLQNAALWPTKPENYPTVGGALGGLVGSLGGPFGAIGGAAVGGGLGAGARDAVYAANDDQRAPADFPSALENVAEDATWQGGFQALGGAVGPALSKTGSFLERRAPRMVRSGLKFSKPEIERRAMIEGRSFDDVANRQAQHIIDNRLTSEGKAQTHVDALGKQIDERVGEFETANPGVGLDFNTRAPKYLSDFLKKIEDNQLLPDQDITAVQSVGPRIMNSPLTRSTAPAAAGPRPIEDTLREVLEAARNINKHAPEVDLPAGQFTEPGMAYSQPSANRVLREDISPSEMLRRVRGKSFYDPNVSEGTIMGGKVLERAGRDSVKEAVPGVAPLLEDQGLSIDAVRALRNYGIREGNADQLRQGALHSLANRNLTAAIALQLMKAGQLKAGVAAGVRGPQLKRTAENMNPDVLANALRALFGGGGGQE